LNKNDNDLKRKKNKYTDLKSKNNFNYQQVGTMVHSLFFNNNRKWTIYYYYDYKIK